MSFKNFKRLLLISCLIFGLGFSPESMFAFSSHESDSYVQNTKKKKQQKRKKQKRKKISQKRVKRKKQAVKRKSVKQPKKSKTSTTHSEKIVAKNALIGAIVKNPEIPPMYSGGSLQMNKFIKENLSYPEEAINNRIQGLVVYTFIVEKDGTLSNFEITHKADPLLDTEALRLLKLMPPWRPAENKGQKVRAIAYVPMYFRVNKNYQKSDSTKQCEQSKELKKKGKRDLALQ